MSSYLELNVTHWSGVAPGNNLHEYFELGESVRYDPAQVRRYQPQNEIQVIHEQD